MNLSTGELTQLRRDAEGYLPDTCTISYLTTTGDTMGGWSESWTDRGTSISCRLAPKTIYGENTEGERIVAGTSWMLTLHHDQTIEVDDRVTHGGKTYQVVGVKDRHSNQTATRAELRLLE
jgi:hypothetical protein